MKIKRKLIKGELKKMLLKGTAVVCAASLLAITPAADGVVKADVEISSETEVKLDAGMKDQALEIAAIVKKKIDLPKGKSDFSFNNVGDSGKRWNFAWSAKDGSWGVYVQCDSKGRIYRMSREEERGEEELPKFKYIGKNLEDKMFKSLEKLIPQTKGNLKVENYRYDSYDGNVMFDLYRTYDGVPVRDNSISVVMDCSTGKMLEMYGNWNYDVKFPSKTGIITKKEAKETGKNALNMELQYILKRERVNSGKESGLYENTYSVKGILCYKGDKDYLSIDALTGEVYDTRDRGNDSSSDDYDDAFNSAADKEEAAGESSGLTQEEIEEIEKLDGLMSAKEAADKVMGKPGLYRPAGMAYSDGRLFREKEGTSDLFYWDLRFKIKEQDDYSYAYAVVNAKTGEIISYHVYTDSKKPAGSLKSESALKEIVVSFMKDNYPEYYAKTRGSDAGETVYWHENGSKWIRGYSYVFTRIENGVPCPENNIFILVSADKGEIYDIIRDWDYVTGFESKSGIISSSEAKDNYFAAREFDLEYEINDVNGKNEARLVYTTEKIYPKRIKASNGKRIYPWGEVYKESKKDGYKYSDIAKSQYKESIEFLAELNIGFDADKFMPDKAITRGEFLELVQKSSLYEMRLSDFEKNPDKEITRMEITRIAFNSLGYGKILKNGDVFNLSYQDRKDIKQADKGYAAMAGVYGFFSNGKKQLGGKFEGNKKLTRGEAASLIAALYRI